MQAAVKKHASDDEARISLPGVPSQVVARIDRRTAAGVTLTRELPLLRVGTRIETEGGRAGRIEGVWIAMDGDVPALCVEVAYEEDRKSGRPPAVRGDATIGYETQARATGHGSGKRLKRPRPDDTNHDATLSYEAPFAVEVEAPRGFGARVRALFRGWAERLLTLVSTLLRPRLSV